MTAVAGGVFRVSRNLVRRVGTAGRVMSALGAAAGMAVAYFVAARLGLALLSASSDVAVFWPASGLAVGVLIISGRRVHPSLVVGVVVGTVTANLLSDRSLLPNQAVGYKTSGIRTSEANVRCQSMYRIVPIMNTAMALCLRASARVSDAAD